MNHLSTSFLIIASLLSLFILNCNDSGKTSITGMISLQNPSVITGIRFTTVQDMEGFSGIVLGNPSYPMQGSKFERINVFPNPYYAYSPLEKNRFDSFVLFRHLPAGQVKIEIYRGIAPGQSPNSHQITNGSVLSRVLTPIQTLQKNDDSPLFRWYLMEEDGSYVPSGLYRAYFSTEEDGIINWVDMYILSRVDCSTWIDPTGWLREDWNLIRIDSDGQIQIIDLCRILSSSY